MLLDGAQGVAERSAVDVRALGCAFYAGSGQKWLCGPIGSGMLWVDPAWHERLAPVGATYLNLENASDGLAAELHPDARRYDAPGVSAETLAAAVAAHDVLAGPGWPEVHARATTLAAQLAERLSAAGRTVAPRAETTLVSFEDDDPEATRDRLAAAGVIIRDLPGTPYVRASVGAWNDEDASWRSPVAGVRSLSRWICSALSSMPSAAVFSSTRETRLVPGIGAMSSPCASSQASATCAGVASSSEATASTSSTMRRFFSKLPSVKRGLVLRQSSSLSSSGERIVPVRKPCPSGE